MHHLLKAIAGRPDPALLENVFPFSLGPAAAVESPDAIFGRRRPCLALGSLHALPSACGAWSAGLYPFRLSLILRGLPRPSRRVVFRGIIRTTEGGMPFRPEERGAGCN